MISRFKEEFKVMFNYSFRIKENKIMETIPNKKYIYIK
jgi:hypothetical protein